MHKVFLYRLYPNQAQEVALGGLLEIARIFYNAALQERRDAWKHGTSLNYYSQANQLRDIRSESPWCASLNYSATQDILRRADKAFKAFFRRCKNGDVPGYPRFKGRDRFDSVTFPSYGDGIKLTDRLYVQNVGKVRIKLHRPIEGNIKTVTLKRLCGKWYVIFSCYIGGTAHIELPAANPVGIDVGLNHFAALSTGEFIDNPRNLRKGLAKLRRAQRKVARRKKGSKRRRKAVADLQKVHVHIKNQRSDFHHRKSRELAKSYDKIVVEDLNIKGLSRGMLAQSVHDAGWGQFLFKIAYKVEETGGQLVRVNPNGTSQMCSGCGFVPEVSKTLAVRVHCCSQCGLVLDRDVNAARNILRLGSSLWDKTWENAPCVSQEAVCFS